MKGKKVLILGMGVSGQSARQFLLEKGADVTCFDDNPALNMGVQKIDLEPFDFVVVSPGISPSEKHYAKAVALNKKIIGETELGAQEIATKEIKNRCIGITGTNGKTTVTLLVEHVLRACGLSAFAVGNVGRPLTSYLLENNDPDAILVIELSSYQLETLSTKILDAAVILNITPDHLDRYSGLDSYAKAKIQIAHCLKEEGSLFVNEKSYNDFHSLFQTFNIQLFGTDIASDVRTDLENVYLNEKLAYKLPQGLFTVLTHDLENMMAAFALVQKFKVTPSQFLDAYLQFKKPAHRLEFVAHVNEVAYYDDSKGTNIDAVIQAVNSLKSPLYLIAGGVDKGASYEPWKALFMDKVKGVFAIGEAANKIKNELFPEISVEIFETLELAVRQAASLATSGESVLLSPGCSSFDMFKDYKERGDEFKKIVMNLKGI